MEVRVAGFPSGVALLDSVEEISARGGEAAGAEREAGWIAHRNCKPIRGR